MMSLLSVTVKKARYVGAQAAQFNTYVTLKLQNVKSTTVTVKGATPCWEQDSLFETSDLNTGLLVEVWNKGMIWDKALGYHWIPLRTVQYSNEDGTGQWFSLDAELVMSEGEVIGTKVATGHSILLDCRFELPFDPENIEALDLQRKLEMLNNIMDQDARAEQARRQMQYFGSGYSEDSDYTSDLNYPVGQHANSSASQFKSAAYQINTPQRSLETSRENSYERDDAPNQSQHLLNQPQHSHQQHLSPETHRRHHTRLSPRSNDYGTSQNLPQYQENHIDSEPLFYNSRPLMSRSNHSSQEAWVSCESNFFNSTTDSMDASYAIDLGYEDPFVSRKVPQRRPSLERQSTLYDDFSYYCDSTVYTAAEITKNTYPGYSSSKYSENTEMFYDTLQFPFQEERYGQDEEDRQWDSGGPKKSKKLPSIPAISKRKSSIIRDGYPFEEFRPTSTPTVRRKMPQIPIKGSVSKPSSIHEQEKFRGTPDSTSRRGASLPPTPTKNTNKILARLGTQNILPNSLPRATGRQLPKPNANYRNSRMKRASLMKRTSSADYSETMADEFDNYYMRPGAVSAGIENFNEDYNYAYQSTDNLQIQSNDLSLVPVENVSTSVNANYVQANKDNYFQDDYYYQHYNQNQYGKVPDVLSGTKRESSPLTQQNTDSLESRDDELKDSFETAVSSVSSSMQQLKQTEYSIAPTANLDVVQKNIFNVSQYPGDHPQQIKAIVPQQPVITVAQVHNNTNTTTVRSNALQRGQLKQQNSVDSTDYVQQSRLLSKGFVDPYDKYPVHNDAYLETQESVESYVEEETDDAIINGMNADYGNKAIIQQDSPLSVIHVDNYEDEHSLRRGSSQITVVDPYHPSLHKNAQTQQQPPTAVGGSRRSSTAESYSRRTSADAYPTFDDQYAAYTRKQSNAEVRAGTLVEQHEDIPEEQRVPDVETNRHEEVLVEEQPEVKTKVTAQQRWLWAYNKIIMQLDVVSVI